MNSKLMVSSPAQKNKIQRLLMNQQRLALHSGSEENTKASIDRPAFETLRLQPINAGAKALDETRKIETEEVVAPNNNTKQKQARRGSREPGKIVSQVNGKRKVEKARK